MKFPCTQCGACCRRVSQFKDFPEPVKEDGSCAHLNEKNQCNIYQNRPLICHIEKFFELYQIELGMSLEEYYLLNIQACNKMITEDNLDPKFKIQI